MNERSISLSEVILGIEYEIVLHDCTKNINQINVNSKLVKEGNMFIAMVGDNVDGHSFVEEAYYKGAKYFILNNDKLPNINYSNFKDVTIIKVENTRECLSQIINNFYYNPSKRFKLIGVTGTNGKTSITTIAKHVFMKLNYKTGLIGTIENYINNTIIDVEKTNPTTPDCVELGAIMDRFVEEHVDIALMEVSSMALKTNRVRKCEFDIVVYSNISPEHLDNHKTMDDYVDSKLLLFDMAKKAVVNIDDEYSERVVKQCQGDIIKYGIKNVDYCDLYAKDIIFTNDNVSFKVVYNNNEITLTIGTPSEFAIYNYLAVIGICLMNGIDLIDMAQILHDDIPIKGRYELIKSDKPFAIIIDYAHTPAALENLLKAVRKNDMYKRVITIFGCGGDKDKRKRSVMGKISQQLSDISIITSDNPRREEPKLIMEDIRNGMDESTKNYYLIEDRKKAIEYAIKIAKVNDVILIVGKGHENVQIFNGYSIEFNDKDVVLSLLDMK